MKWLHRILLRFKPYYLFIEWSKVAVFPGFSTLPIYTVGNFFIQEISKDSLVSKASSLAYNFMLALFPAVIFVFTLIPYIPIDNFQEQLMSLISLVLPKEAYAAVQSTLEDIVKNQNSGLLSFGFFAALFFSTNGIHHLMMAFNKSSLVRESRSWIRQRLVALTLTLVILVALILGLSIITIGEYVISFLKTELRFKDSFWLHLIDLIRWLILIGIYFITISILYRYGPSNPKRWKLFSPGSWLATLLALLTFWGFAFYINSFNSYNKLYGSIGTLIVLMIWLYLNSFIMLLGFELNASVELSKRSIKIVKQQFNSFKNPPEEKLKK